MQGIEIDIKNIVGDIEKNSDFDIIEIETDKDHIHIMLQHIPRVSISSIVNRIKSITTYTIDENFVISYTKQAYYLAYFRIYTNNNEMGLSGKIKCIN